MLCLKYEKVILGDELYYFIREEKAIRVKIRLAED